MDMNNKYSEMAEEQWWNEVKKYRFKFEWLHLDFTDKKKG